MFGRTGNVAGHVEPMAASICAIFFAAGLALTGCSPCQKTNSTACDTDGTACAALAQAAMPPSRATNEFTVLTLNLHQYVSMNRDENPETFEPKPAEETKPLIDSLRALSPDLLVVQEMGSPEDWAEFKAALAGGANEPYAYDAYLRRDPEDRNMALLSRFPIQACQLHTNDLYTIGPRRFPVRRGFLDVTVLARGQTPFRLLAAHLKSKKFHDFGQAEMRRNEARLLCNHVRDAMAETPAVPLLVIGDLNDTPSSAALQEVMNYQGRPLLFDLRPLDRLGDAWTWRGADDDCARLDYALANALLLPMAVPEKCFIPSSPALAIASDHRPIFLTFRTGPVPPAAPDSTPAPAPRVYSMDD